MTAADPNEDFYKSLRKPSIAAEILSEALPYMQRYDQATVVIKYGGHAWAMQNSPKASHATS